MPQQKKYLAIAFLILTILIVIFLAAGISGVEFQSGIIKDNAQELPDLVPAKMPYFNSLIWYYLILAVFWIMLPVSIIVLIKYPEVRKRVLNRLFYLSIYGFVLFLLVRKSQESPAVEEFEETLVENTVRKTQIQTMDFIANAGQSDEKINLLIDLAVLLLIVAVVWYLYRRFFAKAPSTTDQLKAEIEEAITELQAGADLRNAIIRCYAEMSQTIKEQRGIRRQQAMTPREFENELQEIGLPQNAVHRLTRLFEEARYGQTNPGPKAEQEALRCLQDIADACS